MEKRVQLAASKGCDGIEPDNIDAYSNRLNVWLPPFSRSVRISKNDQIRYNSWIADTVHRHGMSVGLKNALTIAAALVSKFDWALVEECNAFSDWSGGEWYKGKYECDYVNVFIKVRGEKGEGWRRDGGGGDCSTFSDCSPFLTALVEECNAFSDWSGGEWYKGKYECDYANVFVKVREREAGKGGGGEGEAWGV
ncbi:unnamed protein product [Closterium sp. NIES-54]